MSKNCFQKDLELTRFVKIFFHCLVSLVDQNLILSFQMEEKN